MRVPYSPGGSQATRNTLVKYTQHGGELPGVQHGTGFFGNLWSGVKKYAIPVMKSVGKELGKEMLPMATQALSAGLGAKGGAKAKLRAAGQSALRKDNLVRFTKATARLVF